MPPLPRVFLKCISSSFFCRQHKLFNKELYADFIAAQIKTLSFLAYIIRIYQVHLFHIYIVLIPTEDTFLSLFDQFNILCMKMILWPKICAAILFIFLFGKWAVTK